MFNGGETWLSQLSPDTIKSSLEEDMSDYKLL